MALFPRSTGPVRRLSGLALVGLALQAACSREDTGGPSGSRQAAAEEGAPGGERIPATLQERAESAPVTIAAGPGTPRALALIIAISDYGPPPAGMKNHRGQDVLAYRPLNAANDVPVVRSALEAHGFAREDIFELLDAAATREGILGALEALVQAAGEGDVVVIHYSGHGHQITDDDGPHDELDGYDEVLVPYGAPAEFAEGYLGEYHIRDDTVGYYVHRLRERVGPTGNITVFLDACYSGTGTRAAHELPVRGGVAPLGPPHPAVAGLPRTRSGGGAPGVGFRPLPPGHAASRPGAPGSGADSGTGSGDGALAPFVVISAASHDEVAHETYGADGQIMGSLSYALSQALPRIRPGDTYNTLFTYVVSALNGKVRQTPQIEGDRDAVVFRSEFVRGVAPSVRVARILEEDRIELDQGGLIGLNPGSLVSLFPPGDALGELVPWVRGAVVRGSPTRAVVELEGRPPEGANLLEARVFAERLAYGEQAVRVAIGASVTPAAADSLRRRLEDAGMVVLVDPTAAPEVLVGVDVVEGHRADDERSPGLARYRSQLAAVAVNGATPLSAPGASVPLLARRVEDWARNQYLRRLQLESPALDVDFELAVVRYLEDDRCSAPDWERATDHPGYEGGGRWNLPAETDYVLRVRNNGDVAVHFAVIDLMPPGDTVTLVKALYPPREQAAGSAVLPPGQALRIPSSCFYTEPAEGLETLKLFVSTDPIPIEQLVGMRTRSSTRRSDVPMTATREIHLLVTGAQAVP